MSIETIKVPDLGGSEDVEVIEVCVAVGDKVEKEDSLLVLETDKASMEVPSPSAGTVKSIKVNNGDSLSMGDIILELETDSIEAVVDDKPAPVKAEPASEPEVTVAPDEPQASTSVETVSVPDIGGATDADVIEICVNVGDTVEEGDSLIVLETDKASMEVPAPKAGKVVSITIKNGDTAAEGVAILELEVTGSGSAPQAAPQPVAESQTAAPSAEPVASAPQATASTSVEAVTVPDIGGATDVDVIEVCVNVGDTVEEGDSLIVLETDKASMEVPAPKAGKVVSLAIKVGDSASLGSAILDLEVTGAVSAPQAAVQAPVATQPAATANNTHEVKEAAPQANKPAADIRGVYAGPAVRMLARELGVDVTEVKGSGPRNRITKDDLKAFVKNGLAKKSSAASPASGSGIPAIPAVDFSKFGDVTTEKLSKIAKVTAANMQRNWLNVPHVTQFDDADISELEDFRKNLKAEAERRGVKVTPLPFILKAVAAALKANPKFNASLHSDGEHIVYKNYINIGMAVDTPAGLMVPVIKDVDKKSIWELAAETVELAGKAKDRKLKPIEMQGACFTISSLGGIGGQGFTPIVNAPEVGILGISKLAVKPVWNGSEFLPRKMLPLCLSYDHRAINGGDAGRFLTYLTQVLADIRLLVL